MQKKHRKFADDGWAIWIDGDNTSTVYLNDWINPRGKSYMDLAVRVCGATISKCLHVYVPYAVSYDEIEDVSLLFQDTRILQATFSAACIIDYKKNAHTSEIAYNGKTVDIVHLSTLDYQVRPLSQGTLIDVDMTGLWPYLDNDEAYFVWRMPHKTLDEIFEPRNMGGLLERLQDLITSPVVSEKYGYSIRINESRLLPQEITRIGAFHRQKLKKAVITLSIDEDFELNDAGCYRIRRLESNLYKGYLPEDYPCEDVITYQWNQSREHNLLGRFNFYYSITNDYVSQGSMFVYLLLLLAVGCAGEYIYDVLTTLVALLK